MSRLSERLTVAPERKRAEDLRQWASTIPGSTLIKDVVPRQRTKVAGVVQTLRIDPREGRGSIEATIYDGSGQLVAKWLGRSSLSGITLGVGLILEGIAGDAEGGLVIVNPEYELVGNPEHG
jgi:hypothetical protein